MEWYLASFEAYKGATGGVPDDATGLLKITSKQFNALEPLDFKIGDNTYTMTPNAQIWPRSLNTQINGTADGIYLVTADLGESSAELSFINGYTFLCVINLFSLDVPPFNLTSFCSERFYTVYDTASSRIGFAPTKVNKSRLSICMPTQISPSTQTRRLIEVAILSDRNLYHTFLKLHQKLTVKRSSYQMTSSNIIHTVKHNTSGAPTLSQNLLGRNALLQSCPRRRFQSEIPSQMIIRVTGPLSPSITGASGAIMF